MENKPDSDGWITNYMIRRPYPPGEALLGPFYELSAARSALAALIRGGEPEAALALSWERYQARILEEEQ